MYELSDIDFGLGRSLDIFGMTSVDSELFGGAFDLLEDAISSFGGFFHLGINLETAFGSSLGFFQLLGLESLGHLLGILFGLLDGLLEEFFLGNLAHLGQLLLNLEFLGFLLLLAKLRCSIKLGGHFLGLLDFGREELDSQLLGSLKLGVDLLPLLVEDVLLTS